MIDKPAITLLIRPIHRCALLVTPLRASRVGSWKSLVKIETPLASYCAVLSSSHSRNHVSASLAARQKCHSCGLSVEYCSHKIEFLNLLCVHMCWARDIDMWSRFVAISARNFLAFRRRIPRRSCRAEVVRSRRSDSRAASFARCISLLVLYRYRTVNYSNRLSVMVLCWCRMSEGSSEINWLWLL